MSTQDEDAEQTNAAPADTLASLEEIELGVQLRCGVSKISAWQLPYHHLHEQCLSARGNRDSTGLRFYTGGHVAVRFLSYLGQCPVMARKLCDGKSIAELGCGVGVLGLLGAAQWCSRALFLSDGDARSIRIARRNFTHFDEMGFFDSQLLQCSCDVLRWGDLSRIQMMRRWLRQCSQSADQLNGSDSEEEAFDIVIGCELMYFNTSVMHLIDTVLALTAPGERKGLFVHAHLFRGGAEQADELITCLHQQQWDSLEVPLHCFLETGEMQQNTHWQSVRCLISGPELTIASILREYNQFNADDLGKIKWTRFKSEVPCDCVDDCSALGSLFSLH